MYFVTSNAYKIEEARKFFPAIEQYELDIEEIQSNDHEVITKDKLLKANESLRGELIIVEDIGFGLNCLNGSPGTNVKQFEELNPSNVYFQICSGFREYSAVVTAAVAVIMPNGKTGFFQNNLNGSIVAPRPGYGVGFYEVFKPEGESQTYSQLGAEKISQIGPRGKCFKELKEFLNLNIFA